MKYPSILSFLRRHFILFILIGIIIRIVAILLTPEIADAKNAHRMAEIFLKTGSIYGTEVLFPYPPLLIYYLGTSAYLSNVLHFPFIYIFKAAPFFADLTILYLIYKITSNKIAAILFAFSPVSIIVATIFGKEDPLIIACVFIAYLLFRSKKPVWQAGFFLGMAIWVKAFAVLLYPYFIARFKNIKDKILFTAICFIPLFVMLAPFVLFQFEAINRMFFTYTGSADYGWLASIKALSAILSGKSINFTPLNPMLPTLLSNSKFLFLITFGAMFYYLQKQKKSLLAIINLVFLLFYIVYGGIGTNFLYWVFPFLVILDTKKAFQYSLFTTLAIIAYITAQFYEPVLKQYDSFLFRTPLYINCLYLISTTVFWFYLIKLYFSLLTQKSSKADEG